MSFPVVDKLVLQNNPDFALLHGKLTNVLLNADGSTKEDAGARQRRQVKDELDKRRLKAAKQHILTRAIATATPEQNSQPQHQQKGRFSGGRTHKSQQHQQADVAEPLIDIVLLLPSLVDQTQQQQLSPAAATLLMTSDPLANLDALLPDLAALLTTQLRSSALSLARIANPTTNPSYLHRHIASLAQSHKTLCDAASAARLSLASARLRTLASLVDLLALYSAGLTALIRALEAKHGVVARSVDLRSAEASLAAMHARFAAESTLHSSRAQIYTPRACGALSTYSAHLRDAKVRAGERVKVLSAELAGYGVGVDGGANKERTMREMARVYRDMARQMDDAKADLDRLHKG
ncbi:hypothetical protein GMORB2_1173 [Geosmithia morbida]|uniref:Uncharacterized protein n=1 Tax=Geosmithia morbida TaxID=1094350 RepID=A0A9P5D4D2_9HYPO|nr:uncharacterized protein GMORB2_1173 [Geosmithia morbida]KAF4125927.1 hypothetical protein GMORB2_1173 [Geosmithia morbida]